MSTVSRTRSGGTNISGKEIVGYHEHLVHSYNRFVHTDNSEVFSETVPNEKASQIHQQTQLLVCNFERNKRMPGDSRIQVSIWDTNINNLERWLYTEGHVHFIPENSVR